MINASGLVHKEDSLRGGATVLNTPTYDNLGARQLRMNEVEEAKKQRKKSDYDKKVGAELEKTNFDRWEPFAKLVDDGRKAYMDKMTQMYEDSYNKTGDYSLTPQQQRELNNDFNGVYNLAKESKVRESMHDKIVALVNADKKGLIDVQATMANAETLGDHSIPLDLNKQYVVYKPQEETYDMQVIKPTKRKTSYENAKGVTVYRTVVESKLPAMLEMQGNKKYKDLFDKEAISLGYKTPEEYLDYVMKTEGNGDKVGNTAKVMYAKSVEGSQSERGTRRDSSGGGNLFFGMGTKNYKAFDLEEAKGNGQTYNYQRTEKDEYGDPQVVASGSFDAEGSLELPQIKFSLNLNNAIDVESGESGTVRKQLPVTVTQSLYNVQKMSGVQPVTTMKKGNYAVANTEDGRTFLVPAKEVAAAYKQRVIREYNKAGIKYDKAKLDRDINEMFFLTPNKPSTSPSSTQSKGSYVNTKGKVITAKEYNKLSPFLKKQYKQK